MSESRLPVGVQFALWAAVLFGSTTPVAKLLIRDTHPVLLAGILYMGSGIGLFLTRAFSRSSANEARLTRSDAPWLLGAIFFGGILAPVLLMAGLSRTSASSASLLLNLEGVCTALLAWVVFKENFDRRIAFGMALIVIGGAVLTCQDEFHLEISRGAVLIVFACLCWGIDNNLTQKVSSTDPYQVASIKGLCAGVFNLVASLVLGVFHCSAQTAVLGLVVGFLGYGLSLAFFVTALRHIGTARTGAYFSLAPFWGTLLAIVMLGERISSSLLIAGALMAVGLWIHVTESHDHAHEHEDLLHDHSHVHDEHHSHPHDDLPDPSSEHAHLHRHERLVHTHFHFPDIHHRHHHS